jgi:hypothetical protein
VGASRLVCMLTPRSRVPKWAPFLTLFQALSYAISSRWIPIDESLKTVENPSPMPRDEDSLTLPFLPFSVSPRTFCSVPFRRFSLFPQPPSSPSWRSEIHGRGTARSGHIQRLQEEGTPREGQRSRRKETHRQGQSSTRLGQGKGRKSLL